MKKNQDLSLHCLRLGSELEGVCDFEGLTIFVPGALPGEEVTARVLKAYPTYAFAKLLEVHTPSPDRVKPACPYYEQCGGCSGQHMRYEATLKAKRAQTLDCLNRIGKLELTPDEVPPVLGAQSEWHCRNKTALPVGGVLGAPQLGFYRKRSHLLTPVQDCLIGMPGLPGVIAAVTAWMREANVQPYDEATGEGLLRHVITRETRAGDVMVLLVATSEKLPDVPSLIKRLAQSTKGFQALHVSVNKRRDNVILGDTSRKLYGADEITETLLGLSFGISPLSFFQVNPAQTERLYQCALDFACLQPQDTVVDAYAGAGTISLCAAGHVKHVIGIEIVPQAVESAKRNAARNGVQNAEFHAAAVEALLPKLVSSGVRPDVIILDPPRKGVEPAVIEAVLKARPKRVVYISCHVPTQARDLKLLHENGYRFERCQPVDMFCYAGGVENVVCMIAQ